MVSTLARADLEAYRRDGYLSPLPLLAPDEATATREAPEAFERDFGDRARRILCRTHSYKEY